MKILVVGSGGREHALADACARSKLVEKVYVAPGSYGMQDVATIVNIEAKDHKALIHFVKEHNIDLTIVGPEDALARGIVNDFQKAGLNIFGPSKEAAQVEASKEFSKKIMDKYNIPTASYQSFHDYQNAVAYVEAKGVPIVIKEDGLKAGKGVSVVHTMSEAVNALNIAFVIPDNRVVIEECLVGFEYSLMSFVCGDLVVPMEIAQDHKCVHDGDTGANTGGMGAYSPVKKITPEIIQQTMDQVMKPMAHAMVKEGVPFVGFLYGGLMLTKDGIKTIEFNARFGDPEAEVILPRLKSDFVQVILDVTNKQEVILEWDANVTLGVVLASTNYPQSSTKGTIIKGLDEVESKVYHMGSGYQEEHYVTNGGRVLCVVASAPTLEEAYRNAYKDVKKIECNDLFYRSDIGKKDMEEV